MKVKVLIIEDEISFAALLKRLLEEEGFAVETTTSVAAALSRVCDNNFDVVLTDLHLGGPNGLEFIRKLRAINPHLPVILMTGQHTTDTTILSIKEGAYDYFRKPDASDFDFDSTQGKWPFVVELSEVIERAAESKRLMTQVKLPDDTATAIGEKSVGDRIIGRSRPMQTVYKEIGRAATSPVTVLIRGETGTGKELVARAIYQHSDRASKPFVVLNCAAIPENLLESELFGHEAGAFTDAKVRRIGRFEQADSGTIFLDEIGDMNLNLQVKLLRVLQEKTLQRLGGKETISVDVRVIAATHRDLELAIQEGNFREDLYYRLNQVVIRLPPLRERIEDIADLAKYFLHRYGPELGTAKPAITPEAIEYLQQQLWPGNVRELRNAVRKALLLTRGYAISRETIAGVLAQMKPPGPATDQTFSAYVSVLLSSAMRGELENVQVILTDTAERELFAQAIRLAAGDQSKAAKWLGVSRPTMREKLIRYGLHPKSESKIERVA